MITSRTLEIDRGCETPRWWHGNDPVATAFFNALSVTFPQGETFFIESVRRFRDAAGQPLQAQINSFIEQEAMHTREHVVFNRLIKQAGYDTQAIEAHTRKRIEVARGRHPIAQLAVTTALEHFTAIMAHALLTEKQVLHGATAEAAKLWRWHAMEEIEHKAVCYDTYLLATRHQRPMKRWAIRCQVMAMVSFQFWCANVRYMADFFRQDGINTPRTWWRAWKFLFVAPGIVRKITLPYLSYYLPGFHPWRHDNRHLIVDVERASASGDRA
ncbi:MAG: metal-dependent hydrolase [Steroidobacteraceae bacterium]